MASCITSKWGDDYSPQVKLTVTQSSSTDTTATLTWTLQYIAEYAVSSSVSKSWSVTINGTQVDSGTFSIGGKTGTHTIDSGTVTITKTTSAQKISFSTSFTFNVTWAGTYAGTKSASDSISVAAKTSYKVSYDANGGSGEPSAQTKWYGTALTLSSTKPTRTGYTFQGWGTSASDTSVDYAAGASYTANAAITLYAIWKAITYTVSYNANGGSGAPSSQTKTYGVALTLSTTVPTRTNYNFKGWGTSSGATTVSYAAGASYTANAAITLYAIWELAYTKPRITNYSVTRTNASSVYDDAGAYATVIFSWATDNAVSAIKVYYKSSSATSWSSVSVSTSGTSGTVSQLLSGISVESSYSVYVTVADSGGTTTSATLTVSSQVFPIDVLAGGNGVAFGKTAETANLFDVNFKARFNQPLLGNCGTSGYLQLGIADATKTHSYFNTGNGNYSYVIPTELGINWARGIYWKNTDDTQLCNIGAYGNSTELTYAYIGSNYSDPWFKIQPDKSATFSGDVTVGRLISNGAVRIAHNYSFAAATSDGTYIAMALLGANDNSLFGYGGYTNEIGYSGYYGNTYVYIISKGNIAFKNSTAYIYFLSDRFRPSVDDTFYLGASGYKWKSVWATTGTIQTSDRNKKEDINPLDSKYEELFAKLKPVSYKLKNTDGNIHDRTHTGFISQDIEEVLEDCGLTALDFAGFCKDEKRTEVQLNEGEDFVVETEVDENGEPVYEYSLRYEEFIALNTHMIQKQQKTIEIQQNEINTLKNEVAELKDLVQQLLGKEK